MLPAATTGVLLGVTPNKPIMSISIKVSEKDEIPDKNIHAVFVRHVRRTAYDAVDLALGSYKTIEFKEDITIGKFAKSQGVIGGKEIYSPSALQFKEARENSPQRARSQNYEWVNITDAFLGLKVELYNGPRWQNHPYNSRYPVLYRGHPAMDQTVTDSMDLELQLPIDGVREIVASKQLRIHLVSPARARNAISYR